MKTQYNRYQIKTKILLVLFLLAGMQIYGQQNRYGNQRNQERFNKQGGMELSEEQKEQIKEIRLAHSKALQPLRNQVNENRARFKTLVTSEDYDQKSVYANIDEHTDLLNKIAKLQADFREQMGSILTEEQKMRMELRSMKQKNRFRKSYKPGHFDGHSRMKRFRARIHQPG